MFLAAFALIAFVISGTIFFLKKDWGMFFGTIGLALWLLAVTALTDVFKG